MIFNIFKNKPSSTPTTDYASEYKMSKNLAFSLAAKEGYPIHFCRTFASKNKHSCHFYWANPNPDFFNNPWTLILNDWEERILYILDIPANSFNISQFYLKSGYLPNIEISPDDFSDIGPGQVNFKPYIIGEIRY